MSEWILVLGWLASGILGSVLVLEFGWRRGRYPLDVTVGRLMFGALMGLFGPANLGVGLVHLGSWCVRRCIHTDRVVFRRKAKP